MFDQLDLLNLLRDISLKDRKTFLYLQPLIKPFCSCIHASSFSSFLRIAKILEATFAELKEGRSGTWVGADYYTKGFFTSFTLHVCQSFFPQGTPSHGTPSLKSSYILTYMKTMKPILEMESRYQQHVMYNSICKASICLFVQLFTNILKYLSQWVAYCSAFNF